MARSVVALTLLILLGVTSPTTASSQQGMDLSPTFIKERTQDLLSKPPFADKRDGYTYKYRWSEGEETQSDVEAPWREWLVTLGGWLDSLGSLVAWVLEVILWVLLLAAFALVLINHKRWLPYLAAKRPAPGPTLPRVLIGRDVSLEPLPEDIVSKAWALWLHGDARGCLSVLYRGALLHIILSRRIQLRDSATEEDCLREVVAVESPERANYFQALTRCWQSTAYAARVPEHTQVEALVHGWRQHFGVPT